MNAEYRQSQAILRAVLESPKDIVIFALDRNYQYLAFNENHKRTMRHIWGVDICVGDNMISLIGREDDRVKARENFDRALAGESFTLIEEYGDERMNRRVYEDVYSPIMGRDNEIIGLTLYLTDITEQRFAEIELEKYRHHLEDLVTERTAQLESAHRQLLHAQKLESLGVLAGGVAHDFNNLLAVILGRSELAARCVSGDNIVRKHLDLIRETVLDARSLTKQLLGYSGKGQFVLDVIDLNDLLGSMKQLLRATVCKSIQIEYDLAAILPAVEVDTTQLTQVIMNLTANAAESILEGSGKVQIKTFAMDLNSDYFSDDTIQIDVIPGHYVCIEIADNGSGMSDEIIGKIFDPFFTTKFSGRGLGLAAVLGIVKSHNGGILIRTAPGAGTCIKVLLPVVNKMISAPTIKQRSPANIEYKGDETILIVDDEARARTVTSEMIETLGFHTLVAEGGKEAVRLFVRHKNRIDLVILDLTMPDMNGKETLRALKRIDPNVKVIVMTGYSENMLRLNFEKNEISGYLLKPFSYNELIPMVDAALCETRQESYRIRSG